MDVLDKYPQLPWYSFGQSLRGSITLYIWDRAERTIVVLPDPLGAGLVFTHKDSHATTISSDHRALARFLATEGKPITKSAHYTANVILTGSGGLFPSSYKDIQVLDPFTYLTISNGELRHHAYPVETWLTEPADDPHQEVHSSYQEILSNTKAASASRHKHKIAHLTGGRDSRMVLGALLHIDAQADFSFYSIQSQQVDRQVAEALAVELGLTMTDYQGAHPASADTVDELLLDTMVTTGGLLPSGPRSTMLSDSPPLMLAGGYGELFRTFKPVNMANAVLDPDLTLFPQKLWGGRGYSFADETSLFTHDYLHLVAERVRASILDSSARGVAPHNLADDFYMRVRNRYWVGLQSRTWSEFGSRFDPLYSLAGIKAAMQLDFPRRRANLVGFEVMGMLDDRLIHYSFGGRHVFDKTYERLRGIPAPAALDQQRRPTFDGRHAPESTRARRGPLAQPSSDQIARAATLDVPSGRVAMYDYARGRLGETIEESMSQVPDFSSVFDQRTLSRLLLDQPESRATMQQVISLYTSCLWLTTPPGSD